MDDVSLANMVIYKTCKEDYNDTICLDLLNDNYTEINEEVQETVSTKLTYISNFHSVRLFSNKVSYFKL